MKLQVIAVLALLVLGACNTSQDVASGGFITKRKYNKGFHINLNKKYKSTKGAEFSKVEEELAVSNEIEINETTPTLPVNAFVSIQSNENFDAIINEESTATTENIEITSYATNVLDKKEIFRTYKSLSKADKKVVKAAKHQMKVKKDYNRNTGRDTDVVLLVVLCFFIPPLAVYLKEGSWTKRCTINLILTILCGLPGLIHALIVVLGD